ncbi:RrF2 family transcriptional regulator [Chloroflexota bacterium]
MKLSTRGRYGARVLLDLALHQGQKTVSLKEVAERERIPLAYLKRLVSPPRHGGTDMEHQRRRGRRGAGPVSREQIGLKEVVEFLEGPLTLADCIHQPEVCDRSTSCVTRDIWGKMGEAMHAVPEPITLQDLVERHRGKEQHGILMYNI